MLLNSCFDVVALKSVRGHHHDPQLGATPRMDVLPRGGAQAASPRLPPGLLGGNRGGEELEEVPRADGVVEGPACRILVISERQRHPACFFLRSS